MLLSIWMLSGNERLLSLSFDSPGLGANFVMMSFDLNFLHFKIPRGLNYQICIHFAVLRRVLRSMYGRDFALILHLMTLESLVIHFLMMLLLDELH